MDWYLDGDVWRAVSRHAAWHIGSVNDGYQLVCTAPTGGSERTILNPDNLPPGLYPTVEAAKAAAEDEDRSL